MSFAAYANPQTASARRNSAPSLSVSCENQFAAKQYSNASLPVLFRSLCEQPPSGPREGCAVFQDFAVGLVAGPLMSE